MKTKVRTTARKPALKRATKIAAAAPNLAQLQARLARFTLLPGAKLPGGVFAGLTYDDGVIEALVVGPEYDGAASWDAVIAWAKGLRVDGCADFFLPNRIHGRILQANVPKLFKPEWYWLGEQHAADSSVAWYQGFDGGFQHGWGKGSKLRARVVRRLAI